MNHTNNSSRSILSDSQASKKSFRVLVKSRTTHQILDPEQESRKSENPLMKNTIEKQSFLSVTNNLKKYIRSMKATSKLTSYDSKINTNRSSHPVSQQQSKITSSRSNLHSSVNIKKSMKSSIAHSKQASRIHIEQSPSLSQKDIPQLNPKHSVRYHTEPQQQLTQTRLPVLRSNLEQYQQSQDLNKESFIKPQETSSRYRISQLENKIQSLLFEKLKMLSSTDSFAQNKEVKNKSVYKLLEKEMDRILEKIRKIKETEETLDDTIEHQAGDKDLEINRNIQMLEKKVKIIQRLIAEKLFESDNLKNQYLKKMKQHRRFISEGSFAKRTKSTNFYRDANALNPSNFKPLAYKKQPICQQDITSNRASYKIPLKSYYITPEKNNFYNPNKLTQPLPRSTYNCQYYIYGALPKEMVQIATGQHDHKVIPNNLSLDKQKSILEGSTYKEDFREKVQKQPVDFRQLDCYKNKFKSLQVNYGKDKNDHKVVNSQSVIKFHEEDRNSLQKKQLFGISSPIRTLNSTKGPSSLMSFKLKQSDAKIKVEELSKTIDQLQQTQSMNSMIQQEDMQKNNLFNQRIKSEIKHKNVYDQKYKFKNELMKEKLKKIENSSRKEKLNTTLTLQC